MKQEENVRTSKMVTGILDILICLLLFISAMYKGAFYKTDSLFINVVICMIGLVCLAVKLVVNIKDGKKIIKSKTGTLLDTLVLLMPICYFLPVMFGTFASKESSIFECIRYVNFAIIYFIVRTTDNKKIYLVSLIVIATALAIFGLDELTFRIFEEPLSNFSINYLSVRNGKLSSTLQYANITSLVMLIASIILESKLIKNLPKLNRESKIQFKFLVALEIFLNILLQTAIILTTSRMNIALMIITTIIYFIHLLKNSNKKIAFSQILLLISSFALVSSIDNYILIQNYNMVAITYIMTFVLSVLFVYLSTKFEIKENKEKIKNKELNKVCIYSIIILLVLSVSFIFKESPLTVEDNSNNGNIIVRNIYTDFKETMDIQMDFTFNKSNTFRLEIFEFDSEFNKNLVLSISQKDVVNGKYTGKLKLKPNTIKLQMDFKALNSSVSLDSLKLDGKSVTLSYMFLPDTMMFRLNDTLNKDFNNTLRTLYYKDSLKLFTLSPIVGIGGEGFKARYQEVQDTPYVSSETHSAPLQILVEAGLIGFITYIAICIVIFVSAVRLYRYDKSKGIMYFLLILSFVVTSTFDLVFSFGLMINIFAIILGLVIGEYKSGAIVEKDKYELDNKSTLSMIKIAVLSISLMTLIIVTIYSANMFKASLYVLAEDEKELDSSYDRVGILEEKVRLDSTNASYLTSLLTEYDVHIDMLNDAYLISETEDKAILREEIDDYIVRQKDIADRLVECEYYNKYALDEVARCYLKHYLAYARIYRYNFKNDEIAYTFYIGYGIKLADRISNIGPVNEVALTLAYNIYSEYLPSLEKQNAIINSVFLNGAVLDMTEKMNELKEKLDI